MTGIQSEQGLSLIELVVTVSVISILLAIAVPKISSTLKFYHLQSAVAAVTGAISSTRYQTVMAGCPFTITFTQGTTTYQLANEPLTGAPPACAAAFANFGNPVSWSGTGDVTLNQTTTLQFAPNGTVTATAGAMALSLTNGSATETITVSGVGSVKVTP